MILEMIRRGLGYGVVIVAMIVAAQPLVAEVAQNKEGRTRQRDASLASEVEKVVPENCSQEDESEAGDPVCHHAPISMSTTSQAKGDQAGGQDEPQQQDVKAGVAQDRRGEDRKSDDGDRD